MAFQAAMGVIFAAKYQLDSAQTEPKEGPKAIFQHL
jgi:hypothetical protein